MFRVCVIALLVTPFVGAAAQSGRLAVSGRVLAASGAPLAGAAVSISADDSPALSFARTDKNGAYRVAMQRGAAALLVTARMLGHAPQFRRVAVAARDSVVNVPEMRLVAIAAALPVVRTVAPRALPSREEHYANYLAAETSLIADMASFLTFDLTGDVTGDASLALGMLPGVSVTTDPRGGPPALSVGGLGSEQNRTTLNGVEFAGSVPRGAAAVRLRTSTYDPATSLSGGLTEQLFYSGTFLARRTVQITLDAPALQATAGTAGAVGQRTLFPVVNASIGGPGKWFVNRYVVSAQGSQRSSRVATLASADAPTLAALGIHPDSARRLLGALAPLGIGNEHGGDIRRRATQGSVFTRLDFRSAGADFGSEAMNGRGSYNGPNGTGPMTYVVAGLSWRDSHGSLQSPFALPMFDSPSRSSQALVQLVDSRPVRDVVLNELRSSVSASRSRVEPIGHMPSALVVLDAHDSEDGHATAIVQGAGTGLGRTRTQDWTWQTTNESQWSALDNRHTFKVVLEGSVQHSSSDRDASLGTFAFPSLADFIANRPAQFSRSLTGTRTDVRGLAGAIALGDKYRPTKNFGIQYGLRAEGYTYDGDSRRNATVDSLFGAASGRLPSALTLSPMVGFTWYLGPLNRQGYADQSHSLTGGIRDYRGFLRARDFESYASETGLGRGALRLACIGDVVPTPDWARYASSEAAIPTACRDGAMPSPFAQTVAPVSLIARDFGLSHSWRTDLRYSRRLGASTFASLAGNMAFNSELPEVTDLNFTGRSQFALASETNRPVFVSPQGIAPLSGAMSTADSRRFNAYGTVMERGSGLRSRARSVTATLDYRPYAWRDGSRTLLPITVAYVLSDVRAQSNGFGSNTSGDPRSIEWESAGASRHTMQISTFVRIADVATMSVGVQARSGQSFTPMVSGDINGDGLQNDRAFVFDPRAVASDSTFAQGMAALLANPSQSGACLRAQLGAIARPRSCAGPAFATMNASIMLDPALTRLRNRGSARIQLTNVLGGIDQLLHGANTRGWGQPTYADPALLFVRGFDAANRRFTYVANPEFGSTTRYRNTFAVPFRVTLDVRFDLGSNPERGFLIRRLVLADTGEVADSATLLKRVKGGVTGLFEGLLTMADRLELSTAQQDTLKRLDYRHSVLRDSVYGAFVGFVLSHRSRADEAMVLQRFHDAVSEVRRSQWRATEAMRTVLTKAQYETLRANTIFLPGALGRQIDAAELERELKRWQWFAY